MKRLKYFLVFILMAQSCVADSGPQCSMSMNESKKSHFFKAQYYIDRRFDNFHVEEAWIENVWHYKQGINIGAIAKEPDAEGCRLVFKLKQNVSAGFLVNDFHNWRIYDPVHDIWVGTRTTHAANNKEVAVYYLEIDDCSLPDSIKLDLSRKTQNMDVNEYAKVGDVVFRKKIK